MKVHIGVDADSRIVHTVTTTAANAHDVKKRTSGCMNGKNWSLQTSVAVALQSATKGKRNTRDATPTAGVALFY